jgi:hemerythrin
VERAALRTTLPEGAWRPPGEVALGGPLYALTGFAPIDAEHLELGACAEELLSAVEGADVPATRQAMAALLAGLADHFAHEENWMERIHYPQRQRHEEAHALFLSDLRRYQAELERGGLDASFRRWALGRLVEWFRFHILAHDVGLGQLLLEAGAEREPGAQEKAAQAEVA